MNIFKIIVSALFLFGCKFSNNSLESRRFKSDASQLFFNANIESKYDDMIDYFKTINSLTEVEIGWTIYPPLSALRQSESIPVQRAFEFKKYLELSSAFRKGTLVVRKIAENQDALNLLKIDLEFSSKKEAEAFYNRVIEDFNTLPVRKEEQTSENSQMTTFFDNGSDSQLGISTLNIDADKRYFVTLALIPMKS